MRNYYYYIDLFLFEFTFFTYLALCDLQIFKILELNSTNKLLCNYITLLIPRFTRAVVRHCIHYLHVRINSKNAIYIQDVLKLLYSFLIADSLRLRIFQEEISIISS